MMPAAIPTVKDAPLSDSGQRSLQIPSDPGEARHVHEEIEQALKAHRYTEHDIFGIRLAVEEAIINGMKHGNQMDRNKKIKIAFQVHSEHFEVIVADEGPGFDPEDVPDPTAPENLERCCGRGLMLMRHYMNEVSYSRCGNSVRMKKVRKK